MSLPRPSRRGFLLGSAGLAGAGMLGPRAWGGVSQPKHLVIVTAVGGWDMAYALDPKPGSPWVDGPDLDEDVDNVDDREAITTFSGIDVMTNEVKRPAVSAFFQAWASRCVLVRGVWVGSIAHEECRVRLLTGTTTPTRPDMGAMVGDALGRDRPLPYMDLGGVSYTGELAAISGRTGSTNQLGQLIDRSTLLLGPDNLLYPQYQPTRRADDAIQAWLQTRHDRFRQHWQGRPQTDQLLEDLDNARTRAAALREGGGDLSGALDRGLSGDFPTQIDVAIGLLTSGISHTVTLDSRLAWDTHDTNSTQHALHDTLFTHLNALAQGLTDAGLFEDTVVLVVSEMTRTPRRNEVGGKDHWPVSGALLLGGPLQGGRVIGGTSETVDALPIDLTTGLPDPTGTVLRYDHLAAGILRALDADSARWFPGVEALRGLVD